MKATENQIQCAIVEWLRLKSIGGKFRFFHIPNGGSRHPAEAARLKKAGVMPGVPDLCIVLDGGRTIWIEVKTATGMSSKAQADWGSWLIFKDHASHIARNVYDVEEIMKPHLEGK